MTQHRAPRRRPALRLGRSLVVLVAALTSLLLASTAAYAYWTTRGTGSGSATTGTLLPPTTVTALSSAGSGSVQVGWTASSGTPSPTGYTVVRRKASDGSTSTACETSTVPVTTTSCTDTSVPDGTYTYVVTAIYKSWTANSTPSGNVTVLATVATTTTLASSANPSQVGQQVTYTATVTASSGTPTGSVTFLDGNTAISCSGGNRTLASGSATCSVTYATTGTRAISAQYGGAGGYGPSTSVSLTQAIGQSSTTTSLVSNANPAAVGQSVTFTSTVAPVAPGAGLPTGSVSVKDGSTVLCTGTLDGSAKATCGFAFSSVTGSPRSLIAVYSGDTAFTTSTSGVLTQTVNKAGTTTSVSASPNPSQVGQTVTYTATVAAAAPGSGTPTGTVTFTEGGVAVTCSGGSRTLSGGTATCLVSYSAAGPHTVIAAYSGDSNYLTSSGSTNQVVSAPTSISALALTNKTNGKAGLIEVGDQVTVSFSATLQPASICSAWTGSSFSTTAAVHFTNTSSGNNMVTVDSWSSTTCGTGAFGSIDLGSSAYVTSPGNSGKTADFAATVTYDAASRSIVVTLGAQSTATSQGTLNQVTSGSVATLTLSSAIKDSSGFAISPLTKATANVAQF